MRIKNVEETAGALSCLDVSQVLGRGRWGVLEQDRCLPVFLFPMDGGIDS
jgi:hypothetical protein